MINSGDKMNNSLSIPKKYKYGIYVVSALIGLAVLFQDNCNDEIIHKIAYYFVFIVLIIINLVLKIYCDKYWEREYNEKINKKDNEINRLKNNYSLTSCNNQCLATFIRTFSKHCSEVSRNFNDIARGICNNGQYDMNIWGLHIAAQALCQIIYEGIKSIYKDVAFEISYVIRDNLYSRNDNIVMIGCRCENNTPCNVYFIERPLKGKNLHYDAELFNNNNPDIVIHAERNEVAQKFKIPYGKRCKYAQFAGIPVVCHTRHMPDGNSSKNMIGLIQIIVTGDNIIEEDKFRKLIEENVVYFRDIFLMFHKIQKALLSSPNSNKK